MARMFGTDGVRGIVGKDLTDALAEAVGYATAKILISEGAKEPKFFIGQDTRESGSELAHAVANGLTKAGADAIFIGVVPTPAVAYLVTELKASAGIMISASHNPYEYNGIKVFGPTGYKLTDEDEDRIEVIAKSVEGSINSLSPIGKISEDKNAINVYIDHLANIYNGDFKGKVLVDCANGSASNTAEKLFKKIGVKADFVANKPDGKNINKGVGSTHIEHICELVKGKYDLGVAFDGDADRIMVVDENGNILDGDYLLAVFSDYLNTKHNLKKKTCVVTVMSNMGFLKFMKDNGMKTEITKVGDRYVLENMLENGYSIGGEQSGHIIFLDHASTGDGQLSAVMLLNALAFEKKKMSEYANIMKKFPQAMVNLKATPEMKMLLETDKVIKDEIKKETKRLADRGRILVRPSGTEPLIRIMVEGEVEDEIQDVLKNLVEVIERQFN